MEAERHSQHLNILPSKKPGTFKNEDFLIFFINRSLFSELSIFLEQSLKASFFQLISVGFVVLHKVSTLSFLFPPVHALNHEELGSSLEFYL